jgi:hypothetical protein
MGVVILFKYGKHVVLTNRCKLFEEFDPASRYDKCVIKNSRHSTKDWI